MSGITLASGKRFLPEEGEALSAQLKADQPTEAPGRSLSQRSALAKTLIQPLLSANTILLLHFLEMNQIQQKQSHISLPCSENGKHYLKST